MLNIFNYSTDNFPVNYPETIIENVGIKNQ